MRLFIASATLATLLTSMATAQTAEPACQAITKAMLIMNDQPGVRQVSAIKGNGGEDQVEAILLPDAMYIRDDKQWRRMPMDATRRKSMAEAALLKMPLSDCTGPQSETLNGTAMNVYEYKQPNPMKPGTKTSAKLWIGAKDGLMHRMEAATVTQTIEYGAFKPPI